MKSSEFIPKQPKKANKNEKKNNLIIQGKKKPDATKEVPPEAKPSVLVCPGAVE